MASTTLLRSTENSGAEDLDNVKVKQIDTLATSLLLDKIYTPAALGPSAKSLRDAVRSVLGA